MSRGSSSPGSNARTSAATVLELQIDTPPRAWRLPRRAKGSALTESLEHLTPAGEYRAIATIWGWRRA
jgi:hypothetical protein